ncbi:MAG: transcriptional repressor, partial [Acetobacter sp.]
EATEHGRHHYHLIDVDNGKVIEFEDPEHEAFMMKVADRLGFEFVSMRLELFGKKRQPASAPSGKTTPRSRRKKDQT